MNIDLENLYVCVMISNPVGFKSRPALYNEFKERMARVGIQIWTCEIAQGETPFQVTQAGDPRVIQLRTVEEIWHKERALNLIIQKLPWDWKYVCWIDADIEFLNNEGENAWYNQAVKALQTYEVVQLFQNCIDMGPEDEVIQTHQGFMYAYLNDRMAKRKGYGAYAHPGYAWGINRSAFDAIGGLFDKAILGSGDNHMAYAFIGRVLDSVDSNISPAYKEELLRYQAKCERFLRRDVGYIKGTIKHSWHGKKKTRAYDTRWRVLTDTQFDPLKDLKPDYQGLYQLHDDGSSTAIELRDRIRRYFRDRLEDSVDAE